MDYYRILGTHKQASAQEIDKAYKKRMHEYNPEKLILQGEEKYSDNMKRVMLINEAYNALRDPDKRKHVDDDPRSAYKHIKKTEKRSEKLFDTTIRKKIENLKQQKMRSIRDKADSAFIENRTLLRDALEGKIEPVERIRDKIERRKSGPLSPKLQETDIQINEDIQEEKFVCPLKPDIEAKTCETHLEKQDKTAAEQEIEPEYTQHDNEAIEELTAPIETQNQAPKIIGPVQEIQLGRHDKDKQHEQDFHNTQALFYKALMLMEKHKYKQAMDIFIHLMPYSESYPYLYVIHACQCAFHLGYYNYILEKTLEAMKAYLSPKYLTFMIDKADNHIFKLLLELFFQNFALCSTKKKIRLKKLITAENEVFKLVRNLSSRNASISGLAGFKSAVAYADLSEIYKEKAFLLKALEKLNYVPKELYDKKTVKRINKIMKKFFTKKEVKSFKMLYPVLRVNA